MKHPSSLEWLFIAALFTSASLYFHASWLFPVIVACVIAAIANIKVFYD